MKKLMVIGVAALVTMAMAQDKTISYADASVQIAEAAESADTMASVMKQLSAADQVKFLSKVNAAIAKQPGSPTENAAKFLAVNSAALKSAKKDNLIALLAETFATVPPEALTVINERFAADLFNRSADPSKPLSDAQFEKVATDTMKAIQARDASADNAGVRDTFAALMFLRASNGTPADLADKLVANMTDANAIKYAKDEWIPPALNDKNYEPMLGASDAGSAPDVGAVLAISGLMTTQALLADLGNVGTEFMSCVGSGSGGLGGLAMFSDDSGLTRVPRSLNKENKYYGGYRRGEKPEEDSDSDCDYVCEPGGYNCQWICK